MTPTKPILRYHGGKWNLAERIIALFPPHATYVEPYCGAASVLLQKPRSRTEVLNDKHARLVSAFRVLRDPHDSARLAQLIRLTPYSENEYHLARELSPDPIEDARRMLVLGHQGHGSTAAAGGKKTGWRRGIRQGSRSSADEWADLHEHIYPWADRLRSVFLENNDALNIIARWDSTETLFYVDPPYVHSTRAFGPQGYAHEMSDADHAQLAATLNQAKGAVVLSGYASPLYDGLYHDWIPYRTTGYADKNKPTEEVIWLNQKAHNAHAFFSQN